MVDRSTVEQIAPQDALRRQRDGARLIDVRGADERALDGAPTAAVHVPLDRLLADPVAALGATGAPLMFLCAVGGRSQRAAEAALAQGLGPVANVAGGFARWCAERLPVDAPDAAPPLDADARERYARHLLLPQVGLAGQQRLAAARVLLVGAGGLGSPAAFYLAAAGVGLLRIADDDRVERSNLQRQILHTDAAIGQPKVRSAAATLRALNPRITVDARAERVDARNIDALLDGIDVAVDGSDNFAVRHLLNAACLRRGLPWVYGAVQQFDGQVSVFDAGRARGDRPCYRCLFPEAPDAGFAPSCAEAGVLGVLPGLVGLLQATEVLKLLLGIGEPLVGRVLQLDALGARTRESRLRPDPDCPACGAAAD